MPPAGIPAFREFRPSHLVSFERNPLPGRLVFQGYPILPSGARIPPEDLEGYRMKHEFNFPNCFHAKESMLTFENRDTDPIPVLICGYYHKSGRCSYHLNVADILENPLLLSQTYALREEYISARSSNSSFDSDVSMESCPSSDSLSEGSSGYDGDSGTDDSSVDGYSDEEEYDSCNDFRVVKPTPEVTSQPLRLIPKKIIVGTERGKSPAARIIRGHSGTRPPSRRGRERDELTVTRGGDDAYVMIPSASSLPRKA